MTEFYAGSDKVYFLCFGNYKMAAMTSNVNFDSYFTFDKNSQTSCPVFTVVFKQRAR
jgi:hypothetical protein